MGTSALIGAWVAAGLTLCMYSFLYKDNPFFKLGEHLYVGISIGYGVSLFFFTAILPKWFNPLFKDGDLWLLIPTLLGILLLTRLTPKYSWLSKITIAFIMGFGSGVGIPRLISSYLLQQTQATVTPLVSRVAEGVAKGGITWSFNDFSNLLIVVGVLTVLVYFFFSIEHKGVIGKATRVGIVFLMISFGASYGYTVMARVSLLYGRLLELKVYSGSQFWYASYVILGVIVATVTIIELLRRQKLKSSE